MRYIDPKTMNADQFMIYIDEHFSLPVEAKWLIRNILNYVRENVPREQQNTALQKMLGFTIGLTTKEIERIEL